MHISEMRKDGTLEIKNILGYIHNLRFLFFALVGATEATALESCKQINSYCNRNMNSTSYIIQLGGAVESQHCSIAKGDNYMSIKFNINIQYVENTGFNHMIEL